MKEPIVTSPSYDVEQGSHREVAEGIKRDLKGRHINMIAIAGMIVSADQITPLFQHADVFRARVSSCRLGKP